MKNSFCIVTDSCSNLTGELIARYGLEIIPLYYIVDGEERLSYSKDEETNLKQYYDLMRKKVPMSTCAIGREQCEGLFREVLDRGEDLLYIGFSSALSASYQVVSALAEELRAEYPQRKIYTVDSLGAALGEGRVVTLAAEKRESGASIEETYEWIEEKKLSVVHLFTVETLSYLFQGGRVKKTSYLLASALNIKPVMHVDAHGALIAGGKAFGRKASLSAIADRVAAQIIEPEKQTIYVGHGDCLADVEYLIAKIKEKVNLGGVVINYIDLVIGAHSGPGTVAIFFVGKGRAS